MAKTIFILPASSSSQPVSCDPCLRGRLTVDCDGYCTDCRENLCHECINHHRKLKVTMEHKILKAGKLIPLLQNDIKSSTGQKCSLHSRNEICSFCEDHNKLCCSVCQSVDHKNCTSVFKLEDYASKSNIDEVVNKLKSKLEDIKEGYMATIKKKAEAQKSLETEKDKALKSLSDNCSNLVNLIDKLRKKTEKNIRSAYAKATELLENTVRDCQERSASLEKLLVTLESKGKAVNEVDAFIDVKLIEHEINRNENVTEYVRKTQIPELMFIENTGVTEALSGIEHLVEVNVFGEHKKERTVKLKKDTDTAKFSGSITDIVIQKDGTIITCDYHYNELVLYDSNLDYISHLHLSFAPTGVCVNEQSNRAIVAHKTKFTAVSLKPVIAVGSTTDTKTPINYNGIASAGNEVYTLHSKGPTVRAYSLTGKKDRQSGVVVSSPAGIAVSTDASWMAVSSFNDNLVVVLDRNLIVTRKIENIPGLEGPFALEIDNKDRIYTSVKNNVLIVTADAKAVKLDDDDSLDGWPIVKHNNRTRKLYLATLPWKTIAIWQP